MHSQQMQLSDSSCFALEGQPKHTHLKNWHIPESIENTKVLPTTITNYSGKLLTSIHWE